MASALENFEDISLSDLERLGPTGQDALVFGVIGFGADTIAQCYNTTEARMAGLNRDAVLGVPFFDAIAQCMNNFMVAQRFVDEPELDDIIPYVLTLKMRPTRVRMRLLASPAHSLRYILIER